MIDRTLPPELRRDREIPAEWVEAAAEAITDAWSYDEDYQAPTMPDLARSALAAALPLMERALKAEALREAAAELPQDCADWYYEDWLRDRAAGLEEA